MRIVDRDFFTVDVVELAQNLLGKIIVRKVDDGSVIKARITETEAYAGYGDTASHAHKGITPRTAPMFEAGGVVYVYLCYGIFEILNFVSGQAGDGQGVMIRGVAPVLEEDEWTTIDKPLEGPGRVGRALQITRSLRFEDLVSSDKIWLENDGVIVKAKQIEKLKRVGIGYALQVDQDRLWRFRLKK